MPTTRLFIYNTGATISGTEKVGNVTAGFPISGVGPSSGGLWWRGGPDEDPGYIIAQPTSGPRTAGNGIEILPGATQQVSFLRSLSKTDSSFLDLVNVHFGLNLSTATDAKNWLNASSRWTSWPGIVQSGLVLHLDASSKTSYPGTGTTWFDLSGQVNNGDFVNGPKFISSNGGSIDFDGADDRISLGNKASLRPTSITHCAWVRGTQFTSWHGIISNMSSWGTGFSMQMGTIQNIALMVSGIYLKTSYTPQLNTWYYVCGTHDSTNSLSTLYVNGAVENTLTHPISYNSNAVTEIGCFYTGGVLPFSGQISSILTYNRALTSQEILQNYNATKARFGL